MGRFERRIKKQMKQDTEKFDTWFEGNQAKLNDFSNTRQSNEQLFNDGSVAKSRRVWFSIVASVFCFIVCLSIVLSFLLSNGSNNIDMTFGDDDVYVAQIDDDRKSNLLNDYTFINSMQIVAFDELRLIEDNSLVLTIIDGELETANDNYFIKVQIEHNRNYTFLYKTVYRDLKYKTAVDGWAVSYEQKSIDPSGLFVYYLHLQNDIGQVIYMEVHCFENDISYILNEFI